MKLRHFPPVSLYYLPKSQDEKLILIVFPFLAAALFFAFLGSNFPMKTGLIVICIIAYVAYVITGYWLNFKREYNDRKFGYRMGSQNFQDRKYGSPLWPQLTFLEEDDEDRIERESLRQSITGTIERKTYSKRIFFYVFVPLFILAAFILDQARSSLLIIVLVGALISAIPALIIAFQIENKKYRDGLNRFHEKFGASSGWFEQSVIQTEPPNNFFPPNEGEKSHGSASWVSEYDKNYFSVWGQGLWLGGGLFNDSLGHLLTSASTGSGKGASIIIPNLLVKRDYPHSFVVLDPKGTNACITARFQRSIGQRVIILDPENIQGDIGSSHGIKGSSFNPLDWLDKRNLLSECKSIIQTLLPQDPKAEAYWTKQARELLSCILLHIMTADEFSGKRNLVSYYEFIRNTVNWNDVFRELLDNEAIDGEIVRSALKFIQINEGADKTFASIAATTADALDWISDPYLKQTLKSSDFNPEDFGKGGITLYLSVNPSRPEAYSVWQKLILLQIFKHNSSPKPYMRAWCYYLLDEFPTLGNFPEIFQYLSISREYNNRIWMFVQNIPQLDVIYGESLRDSIIGNCGVFQAFGVNDAKTANLVSSRLGSRTEYYHTQNNSYSSSESTTYGKEKSTNLGSSHTFGFSENRLSRPLLYPDEVMREKSIITFAERGPMRLYKWEYFKELPIGWVDPHARIWNIFRKLISNNADKNPNFRNQ